MSPFIAHSSLLGQHRQHRSPKPFQSPCRAARRWAHLHTNCSATMWKAGNLHLMKEQTSHTAHPSQTDISVVHLFTLFLITHRRLNLWCLIFMIISTASHPQASNTQSVHAMRVGERACIVQGLARSKDKARTHSCARCCFAACVS